MTKKDAPELRKLIAKAIGGTYCSMTSSDIVRHLEYLGVPAIDTEKMLYSETATDSYDGPWTICDDGAFKLTEDGKLLIKRRNF